MAPTSIQAPPQPAQLTLDDLARELDGYPDVWITCRGYGHAWKAPSKLGTERFHANTGLRVLEFTMDCLRECGVKKFDRYVWAQNRWRAPADKAALGALYDYPDGYLIPGDLHFTRPDYREYRVNKTLGYV